MANSIHASLHEIQVALRVPKDLWNDFGKYPYRNAESILQAVKPLLPKGHTVLVDVEPEVMDGRIVCMCTASLVNDQCATVSAKAYAVEPEGKKGMDSAQVSGATISYAKKYALGNLFAIDGNKDSDAPDAQESKPATKTRKKPQKAAEGDTAPQVVVVEDEVKAAKKALFRAMQKYAEDVDRDINEIVESTFAEKAPEAWTVDELLAKAREFEEAL